MFTIDGETDETNLQVVFGDELSPDFGGEAGGVGVEFAANLDINPDGLDGVLTVWLADADANGYINFNDADNIGDPVDEYIVYSLTYLENTSDADLDVVLEVGSDDAVKVLVNGEQVHLNAVCRGIPAAGGGDRIPVTLRPGRNSILVAVVEQGGGTGVRLIVRDIDDATLADGSVVACLAPLQTPPGAILKPGDVNGDSKFNLSDPVAHLGVLFSGEVLLPCYTVPDSDPVELTPSGWAILDFNGDSRNDLSDVVGELSFLFSGGVPHFLGVECALVQGDCVPKCP